MNKPLLCAVLGACILAAYSCAPQNAFKTLDDQAAIVRNAQIKDPSRLKEIFTSSYFGGADYYRPLVMLSYAAEYRLFGLSAYYYYTDNITLHILSSILVFMILQALLKNTLLAFGIALLFGIHPIHWEEVSNISGRAILLSGLFTLSSFWLFLKKGKIGYSLSLVTFALALLCKESAAVFPLVLLSYQWWLGRDAFKQPLALLNKLLPFFLLVVFYLLLRSQLGITALFAPRSLTEISIESLTFLRGSITYLSLLLFPVDMHYDRSMAFVRGFKDINALFALGFYGLVGFSLFHWRKAITPTLWFLLSWTLIEFLPVSQLVAFIGIQPGYISLAEHFLYMASIGLFAVLGIAAMRIPPSILRVIVPVFFASLFLCTMGATRASRTERAMLERTIHFNPHNARMLYNLGSIYAQESRFAEAERCFHSSSRLSPQTAVKARISEGKALCDQGKYKEGLAVYASIKDAGGLQNLLNNNIKMTLELLRKESSLQTSLSDAM